MKKIYLLLVFMLMFTSKSVFATSKYNTVQPQKNKTSECINEEFDSKYNDKYLDSVTSNIIIGEECNDNELIINSKIFDYISSLTDVMPGDKIKVNLNIKNNSNNKYVYKDKSFILATEDLREYEELGYLTKTDAIGFNNNFIYTDFAPYRTLNSALKKLFLNNNITNINKNNFSNDILNDLLKKENYNGVEDLDKYYLDFYNNKYGLSVTKLEYFSHKIIMEIFDGRMYEVKETNKQIIELSYNWFYNKLFSYTFSENKINDENSEEYSIGNYMRNHLGNDYFTRSFQNIESGTTKILNDMSININGFYTVNTFMMYKFSAYMEYRFLKEQYGTVIINYLDTSNNKLAESISMTDKVGMPYESKSLKFNDYNLDHIEGDVNGNYIDGIKVINYIYDKVTYVLEELPPDTGI